MTPPRPTVRPWWLGAAALGTALFVLYGSYVPFHWKPRAWADAAQNFAWAMRARAIPESRADWVANFALGVPLGFALLGWLRLDRRGGWPTALAALAVVPACTAFAAAVEFGQLFTATRTCAGSDVWGQGVGAAAGCAAWIAAGPWLVDRLRAALDPADVRGSTLPLLAGYAMLLALALWLPFDLSASPRDLWHKLRGGVTWVPFGELLAKADSPPADDYKTLAHWLLTFALYVPAGLLAAGLPGRFRTVNGLGLVAAVGLAGAGVLEAGQLLVQSRHPSATDAMIGAGGFLLGWAAARALADRAVRRVRRPVAATLGCVWCLLLAGVCWQPFDFDPAVFWDRIALLDWLPLAGQAEKNYLWALNEILEKVLAYFPLGALTVWASRKHDRPSRSLAAALVCGAVATGLELGQALLPTRFVSPTDVLFAAAGGAVGGEVARRRLGQPSLRAEPAADRSSRRAGDVVLHLKAEPPAGGASG